MRWLSLFLACQHLNSVRTLRWMRGSELVQGSSGSYVSLFYWCKLFSSSSRGTRTPSWIPPSYYWRIVVIMDHRYFYVHSIFLAHPPSYPMGTRTPGVQAGYVPPSIAGFEDPWNRTSVSPLRPVYSCCDARHRNNLTLYATCDLMTEVPLGAESPR
jgi:hypothetical protein